MYSITALLSSTFPDLNLIWCRPGVAVEHLPVDDPLVEDLLILLDSR